MSGDGMGMGVGVGVGVLVGISNHSILAAKTQHVNNTGQKRGTDRETNMNRV